uniref:Nucleoporin GLE1 n=1 Tax=Schistocephalus solidus TaxID=70667 RepID=A0A183SSK2_SCHSO
LKYDLMQKIESLETRAIVFLTLPPKSVYGDEYTHVDDNIYAPFGRFIADAEFYLRQAVALENKEPLEEVASDIEQVSSPGSESSAEEPLVYIPGLSRTQALRATKVTDNAIFSLLSDPQHRTSTAIVKTIVGSACSQITRNDPEHCLNRMNYLLTFLKGAPVRPPGSGIQGSDQFCLDALPGGLGRTYAWHCLLTAALAQAKHQFAYSLESTLPFAAVMATLLGCYPDQVPHFLSRLTLACPLLASFVDGHLLESLPEVVEPHEGDLTAWRGVARLFAAVLLARTPPGFRDRPPHLNPKLLWLTIAGLIRRPFFPQATAVVRWR